MHTEFTLGEKYFDNKTGEVKKGAKFNSITRVNNLLQKRKAEFIGIPYWFEKHSQEKFYWMDLNETHISSFSFKLYLSNDCSVIEAVNSTPTSIITS